MAEKKRRLFIKSLAQRALGWKENNPSSAWTKPLLITAFLCTCERAVPHRAITSARHLINVPSKEWFPIARNLLALDRRLHSVLSALSPGHFSLHFIYSALSRRDVSSLR